VPTGLSEVSPEQILERTRTDKKRVDGKARYILAQSIGTVGWKFLTTSTIRARWPQSNTCGGATDMSDKKMQKVHLVSLGCPKNTVDSERMLGLLQGNAYDIAEQPEDADVVIVNTCGFIGPAKEESIEAIMAAHRLKDAGNARA
jgi:hypothetical protein